MFKVRHPRSIINRRALTRDLAEQVQRGDSRTRMRANALQIFKAALYRGVGEIRRRFEEEKIRGPEVVCSNAYLVDQLVRSIHDYASVHMYPAAEPAAGEKMAIAATGGYGRAELSPFSDIDLMFLLPHKSTGETEGKVEFILYMLWDLGLKVGHATRSVDECIKLAKGDLTIRTSLLEARWLWGDRELYRRFENQFMTDLVAVTGPDFVQAKLAERDARHERMGDSRYVLEPHIKEGKGGLRDLQTLFWIAKYLYQVKEMGELIDRGIFTVSDARHFRQSQDFLWTVRCHLHYVAGRPEERLNFPVQGSIASRMGYGDRPGHSGVERFMKHYFLVTKEVGDLTRVLCAVLEEEHKKKPRLGFRLPSISFRRPQVTGFALDGDRLNVKSAEAFAEDPVKLLRLFHEAQRHGLDIHPHALRLVRENLRRVDADMRADPEANRLFMEMMLSPSDPERALKRLNEAGVFGRFIPDFGRVVAQMQHDMYHVYTVDEHTIRAIGILHRIETGKLADQHPTATAVIGEIGSRRALFLAVLLHDIAKGRGGDHSEIGADIALDLCPRLGLDAWETETVSWLVRYHLLMSRAAFKRDIDNSKTVSDFVSVVQSPERLRMLLVLTDTDIRAVGPGIWNAWKGGLLSELYYRALEEMEISAGQPEQRRSARVERAKQRLSDRLADWDPDELETYVARGSGDYWLAFDAETQSRHFDMMREADRNGEQLRVEWRANTDRDVTDVTIYAPDHPGLFARIAGAMALSGASIVDAKIITLTSGMALDTFSIQDNRGKPYESPERLRRLADRIKNAESGTLHPARELVSADARSWPSRTDVFEVQPAVLIDNKASTYHTVIEVNGRDRIGFLHTVTSTLTALGLQISSAHVSTYGERVVDVFYVKDVFGMKIDQPWKLRRIKQHLREAISPPSTEDAGAAGTDSSGTIEAAAE